MKFVRWHNSAVGFQLTYCSFDQGALN